MALTGLYTALDLNLSLSLACKGMNLFPARLCCRLNFYLHSCILFSTLLAGIVSFDIKVLVELSHVRGLYEAQFLHG